MNNIITDENIENNNEINDEGRDVKINDKNLNVINNGNNDENIEDICSIEDNIIEEKDNNLINLLNKLTLENQNNITNNLNNDFNLDAKNEEKDNDNYFKNPLFKRIEKKTNINLNNLLSNNKAKKRRFLYPKDDSEEVKEKSKSKDKRKKKYWKY